MSWTRTLGACLVIFVAAASTPAEASDFAVQIEGPGRVVAGHASHLRVRARLTSGSSQNQLDLAVSGLPAGWTASFPDLEATCCGPSTAYRLPITTGLVLTTDPGTMPGPRTVTLTVTERSTGVSRSGSFDLVVEEPPTSAGRPTLDLSPPIPRIGEWESKMTSYGRTHCDGAIGCGLSETCVWYYDGTRVFYQIAEHTGDSSWEACAENVETVYRDGYVLPNGGNVPGYRVFPHGLLIDFERQGDASSRDALLSLERNAAYARGPVSSLVGTDRSREVAYALNTKLAVEDLGETAWQTSLFADVALGHLDQWFVTGNYVDRIAPFMVGLTAEALIGWHERTGDPRVVPALRTALDWLWDNAWIAADRSFWYERTRGGSPGSSGAPDLNGLLAPAYAWLYRQTGEARHRDRADEIFAGGVAGAWLDGGKQFSQLYRWTFAYVRWRTEAAPVPVPSEDAGAPAVDAGAASGGDAGARESDAGRVLGDAGPADVPAEPGAVTGGCSAGGPTRTGIPAIGVGFLLAIGLFYRRRSVR